VTPLARIRQEDAAELERLRSMLLPQHIGMAVGARMLADEVTRYLLDRVAQLREDGVVARRLETHASDAVTEEVLALMREEMARVLHCIRTHAQDWMLAAMRIEGETEALEKRIARLDAMAAEATRRATATAGPDDDTLDEEL
jgi:hypothetical protein